MFKLFRFLNKKTHMAFVGSFFKLLETILELFLPLVMADLIDNGLMDFSLDFVISRAVTMVLFVALGFIFAGICQYSAARCYAELGKNLRNALYRHILTLPYASYDKISGDALGNRINMDTFNVQLSLATMIRLLTRTPFICIGSFIMACIINMEFAMIFLVSIILVSICILIVSKILVKSFDNYQASLDKLSEVSAENISGVRVIRGFAQKEKFFDKVNSLNRKLEMVGEKLSKINALFNPLASLVMNIAIVVTVFFGSIAVSEGSIMVGEISALVTYSLQILLALFVMASMTKIFGKGYVSAKRINEIFALNADGNYEKVTECDNYDVTLKGVCFKYNDLINDVLKDVNLSVKSGKWLGVIGKTSCGKSTLINLISGAYTASCGEVLIGTHNIKNRDLRAVVAACPQRAALFNLSIKDNIILGLPYDEARFNRAVKTAQASFIYDFDKSILTMVSEEGKSLSGGQKQRISLARALYRNPKILLVDDSLSGLDYLTEASLLADLKANYELTAIICSTKMSSLKLCDNIVKLSGGTLRAIANAEVK